MINKSHTIKLFRLWEFYLTILDGANKLDFNYARLHTNVPEFKKMLGSESASKFDKCPIAHVKPNTSPHSNGVEDHSPGGLGKCPIDHTKLMAGAKRSPPELELNMAAKRPKLESSNEKYSPLSQSKVDSPNVELLNNVSGYPAIDFDFNWNTLSNLNLDFLQDYSIFETFQDPNQKTIEDLFQ